MYNETELAHKTKNKKIIKKCGKLYITKYTNVYCVLAISYTKTEPKNDQLTLINPKMSYSQH